MITLLFPQKLRLLLLFYECTLSIKFDKNRQDLWENKSCLFLFFCSFSEILKELG